VTMPGAEGAPATAAAPRAAGAQAAAPPAARRGAAPHAVPRGHRARMAEAPKAPWSPFPLVELCTLVAIVLIAIGLLSGGERRGMLLAGVALAGLAGLELSIREHLAGFRSHSALLAGALAVLVVTPLWLLTALPQVALLAVGMLVLGVGFAALRRAFQVRTGGIGFRV
jgi:hypothetical protein